MNKLVSVIIPTIGRPDYIKGTIDSILMQDYKEIEVLVSDNLPNVSTQSVLGNIIDPRIKIIERNRRYNFSDHMNMCINDAQGTYIMILSDDDLLSSNYVTSMVTKFQEERDMMVGIGIQKVLSESDISIGTYETNCITKSFDGLEFMLAQFRGKLEYPMLTFISMFARRSDVLAMGGYKQYADGSNADNYLFYSLALKGRVGLSGALMGYRIYMASSGLSTSFENLYNATCIYDKDISNKIWATARKSFLYKLYLRLLLKKSSAHMMIYRLFKIYMTKMGKRTLVFNLIRVLVHFLPRNVFYYNHGCRKTQ